MTNRKLLGKLFEIYSVKWITKESLYSSIGKEYPLILLTFIYIECLTNNNLNICVKTQKKARITRKYDIL